MATSLPFILLDSMGFLPFVPKAQPTVFGFLWASLQDYPLTLWLPDHYFCLECACCNTLHSRTKFFVLSLPLPLSSFMHKRMPFEYSSHVWYKCFVTLICTLFQVFHSPQAIIILLVLSKLLKQMPRILVMEVYWNKEFHQSHQSKLSVSILVFGIMHS